MLLSVTAINTAFEIGMLGKNDCLGYDMAKFGVGNLKVITGRLGFERKILLT